ncbi:site-specific integrase [Francisella salina]|uniref:Integrase n=1 Tax=Francisella salina TaxID=573569 RepID=A0ABM5M821_FRAST|nr:site-specific integrase [Francisella salina]AEI35218.1 Integrase [Francisella salina]
MPNIKFTKSELNKIKPSNNIVDYTDPEYKGLVLRVTPSGGKTWRLNYRNKNKVQKRYTIANYNSLTLTQAKLESQRLNGLISQGIDIQADESQKNKDMSFKEYLYDFYLDWYKDNRKSYKTNNDILTKQLQSIHDTKLKDITPSLVSGILYKYQKDTNISDSRVNRIMACLKGAISKASEFGYIDNNSLSKLKLKPVSSSKIRYLDKQETQRFLDTLSKQKNMLLKGIVTIGYYTGMRRGEIFSLRWSDVDYTTNQIILDSKNTKSGKSRAIPIHSEVKKILLKLTKTCKSELVFKSPVTGAALDNIKKSWSRFIAEADIENFRFHDLRHNFCSMLVMKGVPIYTVAQLAGHSDVKTTQIYAHLSPDIKRAAVDLL